MNKSVKKKLFVVIITLCIFFLVGISSLVYTMLNNNETSSRVPLPEYNDLFTKEAQGKLQILATVTGRNREPTSTYIYDKRFNIVVFKVILANNLSLNKIIKYRNEPSNSNVFVVNAGLPSFNFDMKINEAKNNVVSTVNFKSDGDSIRSIANNDSLRCYYYKFETFSISYNDSFYDILAKADQTTIPASILFKKRGKFLYVVLMTIAEGKEEMLPEQLYSIINK